ncbi:MAG: hypothetical protein IPK00_11890 [Deltaproteobacteria bacterium]|nr:hypothetical protein [Deltaproteobacteria bacterium]
MSSTDAARLRRFYVERLEPAARRLRERGVEFFPLGPDPSAKTWYVAPPTGPDFSSLDDEAACGEALREAWTSQGYPELAELVPELMAIARELEVVEEETADISPFVYVMY